MRQSLVGPPEAVNLNAPDSVDGYLGRVAAWVFPPCCVLCGAAGAAGRDLCAACHAQLPRNPVCCACCALPLATAEARCGRCLRRKPHFAGTLAPFLYAYPLDRLLTRFKFSADLAIGRVLADLLLDAAQQLPAVSAATLVVPVPLSVQRLRERGYNQALELARPLARRLGAPLAIDALVRLRATPAQSGLDAATRRRNLRGAFSATQHVRGRQVLLVDDVITTTSTVRECAKVLRGAGAQEVSVLAVARAPARSGTQS